MSICGTTDNPVLDFWWHLIWVSNQSRFYLIRTLWRCMWYMFPEIHLCCNTFASVQCQHSSLSPSPYMCFSIGGMPGFELLTFCLAVWHATRPRPPQLAKTARLCIGKFNGVSLQPKYFQFHAVFGKHFWTIWQKWDGTPSYGNPASTPASWCPATKKKTSSDYFPKHITRVTHFKFSW